MNAKLYHRQSPYHYITFSIFHLTIYPIYSYDYPPCTSYPVINRRALPIVTVHKQIRINRYPNHPNQASQAIIVQLGSVTGRLVTFDNSRVLSRALLSDTQLERIDRDPDKKGSKSPDIEIGAGQQNHAKLKLYVVWPHDLLVIATSITYPRSVADIVPDHRASHCSTLHFCSLISANYSIYWTHHLVSDSDL